MREFFRSLWMVTGEMSPYLLLGFLIATPQTGVDSILATFSLLGLGFAVIRPVAALVTGVCGGLLVNAAGITVRPLAAGDAGGAAGATPGLFRTLCAIVLTLLILFALIMILFERFSRKEAAPATPSKARSNPPMKRLLAAACLAGALAACAPQPAHFELAGNPIITHMYSADPSAHVFGDSLYIYPSHDRDLAMGFDMEDYHCYVTADMQTFEDRGVIFRPFEQTTWAKTRAWAPDCVERNGKYYLYFPTDVKYIGVAVSDRPWGPFADPLGRPLLSIDSPGVVCDRDFIDPCVFIDDDGQAYMFVGQNTCCCIKLNEDMVSYDGEVHIIEGLEEFFEAAWVHKYNGKYYLSYSNSPFNGHQPQIAYAMADSPLGPYEYKGVILGPVSSGTNHHSIVQFGADWFLFYHTGDLGNFNCPDWPGFGSLHRSVCVDYLYYNEDGTIRPVVPTVSEEKLKNNTAFRPARGL